MAGGHSPGRGSRRNGQTSAQVEGDRRFFLPNLGRDRGREGVVAGGQSPGQGSSIEDGYSALVFPSPKNDASARTLKRRPTAPAQWCKPCPPPQSPPRSPSFTKTAPPSWPRSRSRCASPSPPSRWQQRIAGWTHSGSRTRPGSAYLGSAYRAQRASPPRCARCVVWLTPGARAPSSLAVGPQGRESLAPAAAATPNQVNQAGR